MRHVFTRSPVPAGARRMMKAPRTGRLIAPPGGPETLAPSLRSTGPCAIALAPVTPAAQKDLSAAPHTQKESGSRFQWTLSDVRVWLDTARPQWHTGPVLTRGKGAVPFSLPSSNRDCAGSLTSCSCTLSLPYCHPEALFRKPPAHPSVPLLLCRPLFYPEFFKKKTRRKVEGAPPHSLR